MLASPQQSISDGDQDSLFGSPPPSPSRGRSPSPLALPSGTAQNVGTLALPGSHLVAELPVTPPASSPSGVSTSALPRPYLSQVAAPAPSSRIPFQSIGSSSRRNGVETPRSRADIAARRSKKGKGREKSATPRPTPPPIPLPSPDKTPPPNFLRNQEALLGIAGMVGGVHPANLKQVPPTRGTTALNPIVVEDEPLLPTQPFIGKRPTLAGQLTPSSLPQPTSEQILLSLLHQQNVLPVVLSLLRLLFPEAPSLALMKQHPPPPPPGQSFMSPRSQSPEEQIAGSDTSVRISAPPLKRRKLTKVPAGAADWDVPYPFQEGQGPENYRQDWERQRSKQLLEDLVQLVRGAAHKAASKVWFEQQHLHGYTRDGIHVVYGQQPTVNKYYRPKTMYYGIDRGISQQHSTHLQSLRSDSHMSGTSSPSTSSTVSHMGGLPQALPAQPPPVVAGHPGAESFDLSSAAFDELLQSLVAAQQRQDLPPTVSPGVADPTAPSHGLDFTSEDSTEALFNNWLEMLAASPPGDPNEGSDQLAASIDTSMSTGTPSGPSMSSDMLDVDAYRIPDSLIDPALLDLPLNGVLNASAMAPAASAVGNVAGQHSVDHPAASCADSVTAPPSVNLLPETPSLIGSPSVSATSFNDADAGPKTPSWDWSNPESHTLPTSHDVQFFEQWTAMDIDVNVDALFGDASKPSVGEIATEADGTVQAVHGTPVVQPPAPGDQLPESLGAQASEGPRSRLDELASPNLVPELHVVSQPTLETPAAHVSLSEHADHLDLSTISHVPHFEPPPCIHAPATTTTTAVQPYAPARSPPNPLSLHSLPPHIAQSLTASSRAKGKAKAVPSTAEVVGGGTSSALSDGKQDRKAIIDRARKMRGVLAAELERAKVALWETTLEQGVLVGLARELEKEGA